MNRRGFIQAAYGTAGAALITTLGRPEWLHGATARKASDVVYLGPQKIKVTRMAVGLGTNAGNVQRELGLQGAADYLKFAFDQGQFFWDTADAYKTHFHVKQALKSIPREKVTISTKTDVRNTAGDMAADMRAALDRYRQELGTDYIDQVLLHGARSADWPTEMKPVMDVLSEAKEKGIIRTHGASIHSLEALKTAAKTPWCEVHLQCINFAGVRMDGKLDDVVAAMRQSKAAGKGVLGMKILGEGRLRDRIDEALRFAVGLDCLDCFTIGAANRDELADLIRRIPQVSVAS
jgi:aryl-alcohol dehydrogenase-like predicted oxidoreductase